MKHMYKASKISKIVTAYLYFGLYKKALIAR